ncbi:Metallo-dependent phosphatase-like protein [Pilobolus umbonatus]|nr:Metallo-dependent phosphatase-like protein [Pilobolus umbonatus]
MKSIVCLTLICILLIWNNISLEWNSSKLLTADGTLTQPVTSANDVHDTRKKKKKTGYFLHITDMHIDTDYLEGTSFKTACHRAEEDMKQQNTAGKWGSPGGQCDSPIALAEATIRWVASEWRDKLDFIVWTGDNANHKWDKTKQRKRRQIYDLNQRVTDMMMDAFWPHSHNNDNTKMIPVIPSFGNNDVFPHNQMGDDKEDVSLLSFYEQMWREWIPKSQRSTFRKGGYYSVEVVPRLHVITLNTIYFFERNVAIGNCMHHRSPAYKQLIWFEKQLRQAQDDQHKVYVMGHVPPSTRDYKKTCLSEYIRIASIYSDVIMGHFFAHLNMDHFLIYDSNDLSLTDQSYSDPVAQKPFQPSQSDYDDSVHINRDIGEYMGYLRNMYKSIDALDDKKSPSTHEQSLVIIQVAPSILPVYLPSLRIYEYEIEDDSNTTARRPYGSLLGYQQFYANITKWNELRSDDIGYELEYTTRDAYGMRDLSVQSYVSLAKAMIKKNNKSRRLWSLYQNHMVVNTQDFSDTA